MSTYNGWTNYETWAVKLWIDNEQYQQELWLERAQACDGDVSDLADELRDYHEEQMPECTGVYGDLMAAAIGSVNWREIAENLIEDAAEILGDDDAEEAA